MELGHSHFWLSAGDLIKAAHRSPSQPLEAGVTNYQLSMQAFFGVKLVYKYDKYKVATLFFNIGEKKTLQTSAVLTSVAAHILSVDIDQGSIP